MADLNTLSWTSDKDYLEIFAEGSITLNANGTPDADSTFPADPDGPFGFASSTIITHNLGYVPLVRAHWDPDKNGKWYSDKNAAKDPWLKIIATTTQVKLIMNTHGAAKTNIPVWYRIYELKSKSVTSDSNFDKIFKKAYTSKTVGASSGSFTTIESTLTVPHGQDEAPAFTVQFSENGTDWYESGTQIVGPFDTTSGPPGGPYARYFFTSMYAYADDTNLYIVGQNNYTSSKTLQLRYALDYK